MKKKIIAGLLAILVIAACVAVPNFPVWLCEHEEGHAVVVAEATCTEAGQEDSVCDNCEKVIESKILEPRGHTFGEFTLVIEPSPGKNGVEVCYCAECQAQEEREYVCPHEETSVCTIKAATCTEMGQKDTVCIRCETVLESETLDSLGHTFGEFSLVKQPSPNKNGVEARYCTVCQAQEEREYVCPHEETSVCTIKAATCTVNGLNAVVCDLCNITVEEQVLDLLDCTYGNWVYVKEATVLEAGERYKECSCCGNTFYETYEVSMPGDDSIWIEGTDIKKTFTVSSFTQRAVDSYDIVYTETSANDIFVLGHNYGTLGKLYQTKVGSYIYISIDGCITTYKVVVSEYGIQNEAKSDIIGQTTGTSIWHNYGCKTLHLYTCYGIIKDGRWMVLAVPVS